MVQRTDRSDRARRRRPASRPQGRCKLSDNRYPAILRGMKPLDLPFVGRKQRLSDRVADELRAAITERRLPPGSRLPTEAALSQSFGVSRPVVREAVSRLASEGLVESHQGSGLFVPEHRPLTPLRLDPRVHESSSTLEELYELRRAVEAEIAALAALRRSRAQLTAIGRALAAVEAARDAGSDGVEEDLSFHQAIAEACGNRLLQSTWAFLGQYLRGAIRITHSNESRSPAFEAAVHAEHAAIAEAIRLRQPEKARAAVLAHLEGAASRLACAARTH
jgi:GntR family transcriptional repressor for pyruvate dehydrogenase complex